MSTFHYGSTSAVKKFRETRALEAGEVRVAIYSHGNFLFKKIGTWWGDKVMVQYLGEYHQATKVGQGWRLDTEKIEEAKPAPAHETVARDGEP